MTVGESQYRVRHGFWAILALLLASTVGACAADDPKLAGLLADPMADYQAEGIALILSRDQGEGRSLVTDKPILAEVRRGYRIADQDDMQAVLQKAVAFAESQGWRMEQGSAGPTIFVGEKDLEQGHGRIYITLGPAEPIDDPDGPRVLTIRLEYGPALVDFAPVSDEGSTSTEGGN